MAKSINLSQLVELKECLEYVEDPRVRGRSRHLLIDILILSILATLSGAEGIWEIYLFGKQREQWLSRFLELPAGIPSHDTIARVLSIINPLQMEAAFTSWVTDVLLFRKEIKSISLDGKVVKGTDRTFNNTTRPLTMVTAYAHDLGLSLSQSQANSTGIAECDAAIECLKMLNVKNVNVMVDAGLNAKKVINQIIDQGGNYLLPVKANNRLTLREIIEAFEKEESIAKKISNKGHGRKEERICRKLPAKNLSDSFLERYHNAKAIFKITRKRETKDKRFIIQETGEDRKQTYRKNENEVRRSEETTYYVSSTDFTINEAMEQMRKHWHIENSLHWQLDIAFGEDNCQVRMKTLAQSLTFIRKIALNIIKASKTTGSVKGRIKRAGWDTKYLEEIIFGE